jgi:L-lactate dehydrogenase complex protein LldG
LPAALVPEFVEAFHAVRGHAHVAPNHDAAVAQIAAIVREAGATCVALAGVQVLGPSYESATLPLALDGPTIGITGMAFGIAQTGTLAEVCTDDAVRLVSGLPRTHIGVVYASDLAPTLHDAAPRLRALFTQHDANVTVSFISGPSRTGDIELVLTLGVHGPETAHAVIIEDAS